MNFIVRFINHQIGYVYLGVAERLTADKADVVAQLTPLADQGAAGLKTVVHNVLSKYGTLGAEGEVIIDRGIDNLDANTLAAIKNDVPGFVDKAIAELTAHGNEMLAS